MNFATKMKPAQLSDFAGNPDIFGPDGALQLIFHQTATRGAVLPSLLLTGPPGTGKTSLAELYAAFFEDFCLKTGLRSARNYIFNEFGSGEYSKKDFTELVESFQRRNSLTPSQQRTPIIFIDEIHMLSKTQQSTLLSLVEQQTIVIVGATTEPPHRLSEALRSRCRTFQLKPLDEKQTVLLLIKTLNEINPLNPELDEEEQLDCEALAKIAVASAGDARRAVTLLEAAIDQNGRITARSVEIAVSTTCGGANKNTVYFEAISALQKSVRASDPQGALFYLAMLIENKSDLLMVCRRLIVMAAEDVGLADPQALQLAVACHQAVQLVGEEEGRIPMAECVVYLATASKDNSAYMGLWNAQQFIQEQKMAYEQMRPREDYRTAANGPEYVYPHDQGGYVLDSALQVDLQQKAFWQPGKVVKRPE